MDSVFAAVDCGTNSTRLLIAQRTEDNGYTSLHRETNITQLGQGVDENKSLNPSAIDRVLATLISYSDEIAKHSVSQIRVIATSAVRDAENGQVFLDAAEEIVGAKVELLTGVDEAKLSFAGATKGLDKNQAPFLVIDIGGGSTEFAFGSESFDSVFSTDVGCVRITERFIRNDPPLPEELSAALSLIDLHLDDAIMEIPLLLQAQTVIGLAGTVSATSMIEQGLRNYSYEAVHGHIMPKNAIEEVFRLLVTDNRSGRLSNPGMEEGRVDVIVGGLCILAQIMRKFNFEQLQVSEKDILDGIIMNFLR